MEIRIVFELAGFVLSMPRLRRELPRGNGQPLIIVPGFGTTDVATAPLRRLLNGLGYRSEEHTSELQSLMRISYAAFCLQKKKNTRINYTRPYQYSTQSNCSHTHRIK